MRTAVAIAWPILFVGLLAMAALASLGLLDTLPITAAYIPFGLFAVFRWLMWLGRKIPAALYVPYPGRWETTTSVISPVYQEDPTIFRSALESWRRERPTEIILVIDVTDTACIEVARSFPDVRTIVTQKPGKRAALADGIKAASSQIVILVDSDTIWEPGLREAVLAPFRDPGIGGVGTRQNVYRPRSLWQRIADSYLDVRYSDEAPGQTRMGRAVSCLSGRTAAYRRAVLIPLLADFLNERFLGQVCMSGDDKRLTELVLRAGYETYFQSTARVYSMFAVDQRTALRQRLRWARNSFRSDLRAFWDGWIWKKPYLAVMLIDRLLSPYALLVGLGYFIGAVLSAHWTIAAIIGLWWLLSRTVKVIPHLLRRRRDVVILPAFIAATFIIALLKIWALVTVHHQKWLTRAVEVRDGEVVRVDVGAPAARRLPWANRLLGTGVALGMFSTVQLLLLSFGGAGYLAGVSIWIVVVVVSVFATVIFLRGGANALLVSRRGAD